MLKKFLSVLSAAAIMITASATFSAGAAVITIPWEKMDFNGDGAVTLSDTVYFLKYINGSFKVSDPSMFDLDENGVVGNSDLWLMSLRTSSPSSDITWEMV